jgi:hypothetical protein
MTTDETLAAVAADYCISLIEPFIKRNVAQRTVDAIRALINKPNKEVK